MEQLEVIIKQGAKEARKEIKTETFIQEIPNPLVTWIGLLLFFLFDILQSDLHKIFDEFNLFINHYVTFQGPIIG